MTRDAPRPSTAPPGPARHSYLPQPSKADAATPPPPATQPHVREGKGDCPFQKQEETRAQTFGRHMGEVEWVPRPVINSCPMLHDVLSFGCSSF